MKQIFKLTSILFLMIVSCGYAQEGAKDFDEIVYNEFTRGSFSIITVTKNKASFKGKNSEKSVEVSKVKRDELSKLLGKIDLESIKNLDTPTEKRASDRSMHANVTIKIGDKSYTSVTFDADNPPKELKEIIKTVLGVGKPE
ncbi:hypothetical protein ACQY1Q_12240 [Tenacibaculum sp. TC6]|uniref:hypothetical protein n=1 Tax=Tenacibaculum sp. TC6 TaxID=3423223 RepID=UPI003D36A823